jgi:hypothetical protein
MDILVTALIGLAVAFSVGLATAHVMEGRCRQCPFQASLSTQPPPNPADLLALAKHEDQAEAHREGLLSALSTCLEHLPGAVFMVDSQERLVWVRGRQLTERAQQDEHFDPDHLRGMSLWDAIPHGPSRDQTVEGWRKALGGERHTAKLRDSQGGHSFVQWVPTPAPDGKCGAVAISVEIDP